MCGIAGWFGRGSGPDDAEAGKYLQSLNRRGPDNQGIYRDAGVCLLHTRLSIIDASASANQPFTLPDSENVLVYNGEIFNFLELRDDLEKQGMRFRTNSDTEVLFRLLELDGIECLRKLNGFFSFAFYRKDKGELLLARDRFGIKPLSYLETEKGFYFASEQSALPLPDSKTDIDSASLGLYWQLTYIPAPYSVRKNVKKLEPGRYIRIDSNHTVLPKTWYTLTPQKAAKKDKLFDLVSDAVKIRLIADVPVGTFLSGGIDSAIIASLARRHKPDIEAFTVSFPDEPWFDETSNAQILARKHDIKHHVLPASGEDVRQAINDTLDYLDEPFADSSAIAVNLLSRKVSGEITVALSGDGADEIFGGYNKHRALMRSLEPGMLEKLVRTTAVIWKNLPSSRSGAIQNKIRQAAKFSALSGMNPRDQYWHLAGFTSPELINRLLIDRYQEEESSRRQYLLREFDNGKPLESSLLTDLRLVLPGDMLTKTDRMSMCHSLEVRVPFLDYRVAELGINLPVGEKLNRNKGKLILRKTFADLIPEETLSKGKKGFEVPLGKWMRQFAGERLAGAADPTFLQDQGLFDSGYTGKLINKFMKGDDSLATPVWQLLVFQSWYRKTFPNG